MKIKNNFLAFKKYFSQEKFRERILVFRIPSQIGDTIVAIPAFKLIKKRHPNAKIILLTNYSQKNPFKPKSLLSQIEVFDEFLVYKNNLISLLKISLKIRIINPNKMYYLGYAFSKKRLLRDSLFFATLCGIKLIQGLKINSDNLKIKFNDKGKPIKMQKESKRLSQIIEKKDDALELRPYIKVSDFSLNKARTLINQIKHYSFIIGIGHESKLKEKNWPIEKFSNLIKEILQYDDDIAFVILGSKENKITGDDIRNTTNQKRVINLAGETSILESAAILSLCKLFIGVDSGSMHLASAMNVRCIALFSIISNPGLWEPFGNQNIIIRNYERYFSKELYSPNNLKKSMEMIKEKEVFIAFKKIKENIDKN